MRITLIALLALGLPMAVNAQESAARFAISCKVSAESTYQRKITRSWPTRVYVLDPTQKVISYWNEDREELIPVCDIKWKTCSITFGLRYIEAKGDLNKGHGFYMIIDRRTGFIDYRSSSQYGNSPQTVSDWSFAGPCTPTDIPDPHLEKNIF